MNDRYHQLRKELWHFAHEQLAPYYDIDKVKDYSVYVWTKGDDGENFFDIYENKIVWYVPDHVIPEEVWPIIREIWYKLEEIRLSVGG